MGECGCLAPMCNLLECHDPKVVSVCLEGISNILQAGETDSNDNPYALLLEQSGGLDKVEALQEHGNEKIYEKAVDVLESFFGLDDVEDQVLAPTIMQNDANFQFGVKGPPMQPFNFAEFGTPAANPGMQQAQQQPPQG